MTQQFFGLLTRIGENKQAAAQAINRLVQITHMAVGDGGGATPIPDRAQTALIDEKRRAPLNTLKQDENNPNYLIAEQVIPEDAGGWYIREIGLYDADGDLVAVANCPETYKPVLAEGSAREQIVRLVLMVASTAAFVLKIDPAVVLATRKYVDDKLHKNISVTGGATADAVALDGAGDIQIVVKALDVSKATAGTLPVPRGGTGLASVAAGSYLKGDGVNALVPRTPAEVFQDLQIAAAITQALASYPKAYSILALPAQDQGPILVIEAAEIWTWVSTAYFTGYKSPLCGRPVDGHTVSPLPSEVDAVGGLLSKTAYGALWGYAQQNGLLVSQAVWTANVGAHYFVDVDANNFRVPDLRNMFRRYTGTDADTANARALGSRQTAQLQSHAHNLRYSNTAAASGANQSVLDGGGALTYTTLVTGGTETRPVNAAYHPRIHA
ncbi:hypothetical protein AKI39_03175 [Bordetella sp. H567]|uniref:phage tail protein n=1 Tax=Bordetella sp. H567 TaxID=1697043 RepID=UPI00081CD22C|nr:phage tail protein [Bordetella sp. H567]AOB29905.1 hypothetical protein AKI39_03175 [Bordetella sp. H567]